jgi:hypothetical protein
MQSTVTEPSEKLSLDYTETQKGNLLLDLDDYPGRPSVANDEFLLDIDLDDVPDTSPVESAFPTAEFARQAQFKARAANWSNLPETNVEDEVPPATADQMATTQEFERPDVEVHQESAIETMAPDLPVAAEATEPGVGAGAPQTVSQPWFVDNVQSSVAIQQLSPELIDAIARRAVAQMSEKVVQEIAWEVVPQLAELLIKRQLEEKNS